MKIITGALQLLVYGSVAISAAVVRPNEENKFENSMQMVVQNHSELFSPTTGIWNSMQKLTSAESTTKILSSTVFNDAKREDELPSYLLEKFTSVLQRPNHSNKQLFGGRLPPFIERIIQRIQNYFSVYNPPEYFDSNRPLLPAENEGMTIICSNKANDSLSCNETNAEESSDEHENVEICDSNSLTTVNPCISNPNLVECQQTNVETMPGEYNVVVTHTVVQDNLLNVFSPADITHTVSNVMVILEPSTRNATKNKFYVYVDPSAVATSNTDDYTEEQKISNQNFAKKREDFSPYANTSYAVIIRRDSLEDYNTNISNDENESVHPDIKVLAVNPIANESNITRCKLLKINCSQEIENDSSISVASRSITNTTDELTKKSEVPSINLALVPPDQNSSRNKSCLSSEDKVSNTIKLEYYILKPDTSNNKIINSTEKHTYHLHKSYTNDVFSPTYLPPSTLPKNRRFNT